MDAWEEGFEPMKLEFFKMLQNFHQMRPFSVRACEGVTETEASALHVIGIIGHYVGADAARPGLVATQLHVTPSALSQVLRTLDDKGLIVRNRSRDDSRAVTLTLTAEGDQIFRKIDAQECARARALVNYVGIENFKVLIRTAQLAVEFEQKLASGELTLDDEGVDGNEGVDGVDGDDESAGDTSCA